jgi:uncharacterized membrane protein YeaQ/YmgE (transglycosylase-associated protein family)
MIMSPTTAFLLVLVIGIAVGLVFDRLAGPGWLTRQIAGSTRTMMTSALIGIAGAFIGYHIALVLVLARSAYVPLIFAAAGAAVILWLWRMVR